MLFGLNIMPAYAYEYTIIEHKITTILILKENIYTKILFKLIIRKSYFLTRGQLYLISLHEFSFSPSIGKIELTRNKMDQTVNIVLKDEDVNNSLGEVSATSHNAKKVIFTIKESNGLQSKHEMVR